MGATTPNLEYLQHADLSEHEGEWIAVHEEEIVESQPTEKELLEAIRDIDDALVTKVHDSHKAMVV